MFDKNQKSKEITDFTELKSKEDASKMIKNRFIYVLSKDTQGLKIDPDGS